MDTPVIASLIFILTGVVYAVYQYVNYKKKNEKAYQLASPFFLMIAAVGMCVFISFTLVILGVVK